MLGDKRFLRTIKLRNILSFGPDTPELELKSLNVLIGPNGSGKSNLIEAIGMLQAAASGLVPKHPVVRSGHARAGTEVAERSHWAEWVWEIQSDRGNRAASGGV